MNNQIYWSMVSQNPEALGSLSAQECVSLLADLLNILQKHNWRDESAVDTLKRIIIERDSCTSALSCAFDALKDHTRQP